MKRDAEGYRLLIGILGVAFLMVMTMVTAVFLVSRRPVVVVVKGGGESVAAAAPAAQASAPAAEAAAPSAAPMPEISVSKVPTAPSSEDPFDPAWDKIAVVEVDLQPQQVASPILEKSTVGKLRVQAARDDRRYVWRLSWDKAENADKSDVAQFADAVAMQFPLVDGVPYTMGGPGLPVRMLYWRSSWQTDVEKGFQGVAGVHPHTDADLYWFAEGKDRHGAAGSLDNPTAKQWFIAAQSGNPMADFQRKHPIEEMTAHGFGSATHVTDTPSRGRGAWKDGQWRVVIDRPIATDDPLIKRFVANPEKQLIAFAVWDGSAGNRGGKKQITNWLPMKIMP